MTFTKQSGNTSPRGKHPLRTQRNGAHSHQPKDEPENKAYQNANCTNESCTKDTAILDDIVVNWVEITGQLAEEKEDSELDRRHSRHREQTESSECLWSSSSSDSSDSDEELSLAARVGGVRLVRR